MIKRGTGKKKKGFTLIELVIVLAVMAIIALIAIPNFSAIRDNSKNKADKESCDVIKRTTLMLVSDESIKVSEDVTVKLKFDGEKASTVEVSKGNLEKVNKDTLEDALKDVKKPQGNVPTISDKDEWTYEKDKKVVADQYQIEIKKDGNVKVQPIGGTANGEKTNK